MAKKKIVLKLQRAATSEDVEIGRRLRLYRIESGKSQNEVAEALGVSFQQIQKYEKGTNRVSLKRASEICRLLKVSPLELMAWDSDFKVTTPINGVTVGLVAEFEQLDQNIKTPMKSLIKAILNSYK